MESKATRGHLGRARMSRAQITEGESEAACRCRDAQGAGMGGIIAGNRWDMVRTPKATEQTTSESQCSLWS